MKRNNHTFRFTADQIAKAATAEQEYHEQRVLWWQVEYNTAVKEAQEKGVEVREYEATGGKQAQLVIDPTLQARINQCVSKINAHKALADRFKIEAAAYGSQGPDSSGLPPAYDLDPDDVVYFRLAGGSRDE